jgi:hypothetical protein
MIPLICLAGGLALAGLLAGAYWVLDPDPHAPYDVGNGHGSGCRCPTCEAIRHENAAW